MTTAECKQCNGTGRYKVDSGVAGLGFWVTCDCGAARPPLVMQALLDMFQAMDSNERTATLRYFSDLYGFVLVRKGA